jgi:hypothetical protein
MRHSLEKSPETPEPSEADGPDRKIIRLVPRPTQEPERMPDPPDADDNDPGPAAA